MKTTQHCPLCKKDKPYDADVWRNYSREPGSRTKYVCGECAPPEGAMIGTNLESQPLELDRFEAEGLKAPCKVEGCKGVIMISRDHQTFHLNPDNVYCHLCGQHYTIDTKGLVGWPLEEMLRRCSVDNDE